MKSESSIPVRNIIIDHCEINTLQSVTSVGILSRPSCGIFSSLSVYLDELNKHSQETEVVVV